MRKASVTPVDYRFPNVEVVLEDIPRYLYDDGH
jgi:hypothetical protein